MKFLILIIVGNLLFTGQIYCSDTKTERLLFEECAKELGVKMEKFPEKYDSKFKCVAACTIKKMGLMKDGKVDVTQFLIYSMKGNMTENKVKEALDCVARGNNEIHECDVFDVSIKCMESLKPTWNDVSM